MACQPAFGHMEKVSYLAEGLQKLGYPVTLITSWGFEDHIKSSGLEFKPLEGTGGAGNQLLSDDDLAAFLALKGLDRELFAIKKFFINAMPDHARTVQKVFTKFKEDHGADKPLIFVYDSSFQGLTPVLLGAPGIRPDAAIGIGLAPFTAASNDSMPFRSGKKPDTSPVSRQVHHQALLAQGEELFFKETDIAFKETLRSMGASSPIPTMWDAFSLLPETLLQYGIPEFEYTRSDLRPNVKWIGAPRTVGIIARDLPSWWDDVLEAKTTGRPIIAITSSSVDFNVEHLIVPALEALKDRDDVLVVATLVTSDVDSMSYLIPANARVAKFIPLDLLLPHVSSLLLPLKVPESLQLYFLRLPWPLQSNQVVILQGDQLVGLFADIAKVSILISNGGYGTVQQALSNGVPMILAGIGQDKAQTGPIAEYTGVGIYLPFETTTSEMISEAVGKIQGNGEYKDQAAKLAERYLEYDPIAITDETVQEALIKTIKSRSEAY
ncbi:hypothetical protein MMC08_000507 [Hypocenomyce scalaris]|nr:hypothetical protein [Hypocenomyce scalaris]